MVFLHAVMNQQSIILFDGVCSLCNSVIQFIIKRDKKNYFSFASLQSVQGQKILSQCNPPPNDVNSFVLVENGKPYTRSTGALKVAKKLNGLWPLLYCFIIIPKFIRDGLYKWIAGHRYKWFGRKNECMIPPAELRARFLN